jgi:hypothetical protein
VAGEDEEEVAEELGTRGNEVEEVEDADES